MSSLELEVCKSWLNEFDRVYHLCERIIEFLIDEKEPLAKAYKTMIVDVDGCIRLISWLKKGFSWQEVVGDRFVSHVVKVEFSSLAELDFELSLRGF